MRIHNKGFGGQIRKISIFFIEKKSLPRAMCYEIFFV